MTTEKDQKVPDYINFLPKSAQYQYTEQATAENLSAEIDSLRQDIRILSESVRTLIDAEKVAPAQPVAVASAPSDTFRAISEFSQAMAAMNGMRNSFIQDYKDMVSMIRDDVGAEEPESRDDMILKMAFDTLANRRGDGAVAKQTPFTTSAAPAAPTNPPQQERGDTVKVTDDEIVRNMPETVKRGIRKGFISKEDFFSGAMDEARRHKLTVDDSALEGAYKKVMNDGRPSKLSDDSKPAKARKKGD